MARLDPFYRIHHILEGRKTPIQKTDLARKLECSTRTVTRHIESMQLSFDAPIRWFPRRGWMYDPDRRDRWEVPGLWMTREEIQSLILLLDILNRFGNGLLNDELRGVRTSVDKLLARHEIDRNALAERFRVIPVGHRAMDEHHLHHVLAALIDRHQLQIRYRDFKAVASTRDISPQRLVYYRDNWYVDAWCHKRSDLRTFSIARFDWSLIKNESAAKDVAHEALDNHFKRSYGVFAGAPDQIARLRFREPIATEISRQRWHTDQQGRWEQDDYVLEVPFSDPTELIQDVQRYLPHVVVEGPDSLRDRIAENLTVALERFTDTG